MVWRGVSHFHLLMTDSPRTAVKTLEEKSCIQTVSEKEDPLKMFILEITPQCPGTCNRNQCSTALRHFQSTLGVKGEKSQADRVRNLRMRRRSFKERHGR